MVLFILYRAAIRKMKFANQAVKNGFNMPFFPNA
jgi:hypothetical protein